MLEARKVVIGEHITIAITCYGKIRLDVRHLSEIHDSPSKNHEGMDIR